MDSDNSFLEFLERLKQGDDDAAAEVFQLYANRLIGLAYNRLDSRIQQKVDPEDVMLSAFKSFFRRQKDGAFELTGWDSLWALLVGITVRKCGRQIATFRSAKRDINRELTPRDDDAPGFEASASEPTPQEAAMLVEMLEGLMQDLSPRDRTILAMRLDGYNILEIAEKVDRTERTVSRTLRRVREQLEQIDSEDS